MYLVAAFLAVLAGVMLVISLFYLLLYWLLRNQQDLNNDARILESGWARAVEAAKEKNGPPKL